MTMDEIIALIGVYLVVIMLGIGLIYNFISGRL